MAVQGFNSLWGIVLFYFCLFIYFFISSSTIIVVHLFCALYYLCYSPSCKIWKLKESIRFKDFYRFNVLDFTNISLSFNWFDFMGSYSLSFFFRAFYPCFYCDPSFWNKRFCEWSKRVRDYPAIDRRIKNQEIRECFAITSFSPKASYSYGLIISFNSVYFNGDSLFYCTFYGEKR